MASNGESNEVDGPIDPNLGAQLLAMPAGRNNQNMMVTETQINTRTMEVLSNRPASQEINRVLPMQTESLGNEQRREPTYAQSGSNNVAAYHGSQIFVNHYHGSQGKTPEHEFTEWAMEQALSDDTVKVLKQCGITTKSALQRAKDERINALLPLLPEVQRDFLLEAKVNLGGPQLPAIASAPNMIESSSDEVDGIPRNNSRASVSSASSTSSLQSLPPRLPSSAQSKSPWQPTLELSTPNDCITDSFNDYLLFGLSLKTLCTPVSIQGIGLKLLGSEVALSHCNDPNETMKIYKIYMRWRQQMNEQRKNLDEMAELLRRALIETENAMALVFLDGFLNPSSEPRQETLFSKDEFFLRLANKTSHGEHVGMMLLDSFAESDKCSHDACKIYLKWRNKMMCDGVNDQEMRKILWNVLHTTENGDARDFLKDSLNDHDLQLATAAQLATNTASTS